jgi:hypothetical protein
LRGNLQACKEIIGGLNDVRFVIVHKLGMTLDYIWAQLVQGRHPISGATVVLDEFAESFVNAYRAKFGYLVEDETLRGVLRGHCTENMVKVQKKPEMNFTF